MREAEEESPTLVCDILPVTQLVSERQGWVCNLSLLNLDSMLFLPCHAVFISRVCDSVALFTPDTHLYCGNGSLTPAVQRCPAKWDAQS